MDIYKDCYQTVEVFFFSASERWQLIVINICSMVLSKRQTVRLHAYQNLLLPSTGLCFPDVHGDSNPTLTCAQCLFSDVACAVPLTCTFFLCCVSSFHLQSDKMLWLHPASLRFIFQFFCFPNPVRLCKSNCFRLVRLLLLHVVRFSFVRCAWWYELFVCRDYILSPVLLLFFLFLNETLSL